MDIIENDNEMYLLVLLTSYFFIAEWWEEENEKCSTFLKETKILERDFTLTNDQLFFLEIKIVGIGLPCTSYSPEYERTRTVFAVKCLVNSKTFI